MGQLPGLALAADREAAELIVSARLEAQEALPGDGGGHLQDVRHQRRRVRPVRASS
jgi:hypothetical protein